MKLKTIARATSLALVLSGAAHSAEISVTLTNLTGGIHFTPRLLVAHNNAVDLFEIGGAASTGLATLAEGGDTSVLGKSLDSMMDSNRHATVGDVLAPKTTTGAYTLETGGHGYLSMAAMMLPTNDGFIGLDSWKIPDQPGTYTVMLDAYDAGTETNNEIINGAGMLGMAGIPAAPGGDGGTGATGVTMTETNMTVHVHQGLMGDMDAMGGISDVDSSVHRWMNPVAKLTVVVK